jgi:chloride channel 3/4/5
LSHVHRPRVILVAQEGQLLGLVTVKDVLRHEAAVEHAHRTRQQQVVAPDWRDGLWNMEENAAGLEVVLEEALTRFKAATSGVRSLLERVLGKAGFGGRPAPDPHDRSVAEEYELESDRR